MTTKQKQVTTTHEADAVQLRNAYDAVAKGIAEAKAGTGASKQATATLRKFCVSMRDRYAVEYGDGAKALEEAERIIVDTARHALAAFIKANPMPENSDAPIAKTPWFNAWQNAVKNPVNNGINKALADIGSPHICKVAYGKDDTHSGPRLTVEKAVTVDVTADTLWRDAFDAMKKAMAKMPREAFTDVTSARLKLAWDSAALDAKPFAEMTK